MIVGIFLLVLFFTFPSFAAENKHHIDLKYEKCLDKDFSTHATLKCTDQAYLDWDKELNSVYGELKKKLDPVSLKILMKSQLEWIKFRDNEFKLIDSLYDRKEGTMYIPMRVASKVDFVRKRVFELSSYLELLEY